MGSRDTTTSPTGTDAAFTINPEGVAPLIGRGPQRKACASPIDSHPRQRAKRASEGETSGVPSEAFTLIELAIITVILGILLTAAIPRLQQTARRMRVEQSAFELAQLLRAAHEQAVAGGREVVWIWDADRRRARLEPGEAMTSRSFPEGLSVLLTQDGQAVACNCVRFFPEGTSEPATLTVRLQEQLITATVDDATGQVRLVPGAVAR